MGLLLALRLGQAGIRTIVLESHKKLLPTIRAIVYMPIVFTIFRKLGIFDTIITHSYPNYCGVSWRDVDGNELAHLTIESENPYEFGGVLIIGQRRMNELILKEIKKHPTVEVRFGEKVVNIEDNATKLNGAKVKTQKRSDSKEALDLAAHSFYRAKYVVGADGANSLVREIFGVVSLPFPNVPGKDFLLTCWQIYEGFTWENMKMISIDIRYDFIRHRRFGPINFIVDPIEWCAIAYTGEDEFGLDSGPGAAIWRIAYSKDRDLPDDKQSIMDRAYERVQRFIKASDSNVPDGLGTFKIT